MTTIVGVCGSLRRGSFNLMLLRAVAEAMPSDVTVQIGSIREIPLYNADDESAGGVPAAAQRLKDQIAAADGLLIVTPEYNNAMPGVLKNAIDWLSRPPVDIARVFRGRPTGIVGATPGMGGTILSQASWLPVLRVLGVLPYFEGRVIVSGAGKVFDESGRIVDAGTSERVRTYAEGFAAFVQQHRRAQI
jgi:NAD(P)H-dependent FMN reductase